VDRKSDKEIINVIHMRKSDRKTIHMTSR